MNILFLLSKKKYYDLILCQFFFGVPVHSLFKYKKKVEMETQEDNAIWKWYELKGEELVNFLFDSMIHSDIIQSVSEPQSVTELKALLKFKVLLFWFYEKWCKHFVFRDNMKSPLQMSCCK